MDLEAWSDSKILSESLCRDVHFLFPIPTLPCITILYFLNALFRFSSISAPLLCSSISSTFIPAFPAGVHLVFLSSSSEPPFCQFSHLEEMHSSAAAKAELLPLSSIKPVLQKKAISVRGNRSGLAKNGLVRKNCPRQHWTILWKP